VWFDNRVSLTLAPDLVEPVAGALLCGIDVDDGPTSEQLLVLSIFVEHLWGRPDLDVRMLRKVGAHELAEYLPREAERTMFHELHLALETCRHPQSQAQVESVEEFARVLDVDGEDLVIFRDLMTKGVDAATLDYRRFLADDFRDREEPTLAGTITDPDHPDLDLAEKLGSFAEYGPGSLGQAYVNFYEKAGLSLPGIDPSANNSFFVAHDMTHTIAGLSTTSPAEIALSAFQFAMENNRVNRAALLASLVAHEAGFAHPAHLASNEAGLLADPIAARLLGEEMHRGGLCRGDFSLVDHFELAPMALCDVRAEFGVQPPRNPRDIHHWW
jgi:hypothetical protein